MNILQLIKSLSDAISSREDNKLHSYISSDNRDKLTNLNNYSLTPIKIGCWIDNKDIYQVVVINSGKTTDINLSAYDIDTLIDKNIIEDYDEPNLDGMGISNNGQFTVSRDTNWNPLTGILQCNTGYIPKYVVIEYTRKTE